VHNVETDAEIGQKDDPEPCSLPIW